MSCETWPTYPIEKVEIPRAPATVETWVNGKSAELLGFEFEGRKNFGFLGPRFRGLNLQTNVTYLPHKTTKIPVAVVNGLETSQTNTERDPADIPDFIVNAAVDYTIPDVVSARVLYSTVGPTLVRAGSLGLPDAVEQRNDVLDVGFR